MESVEMQKRDYDEEVIRLSAEEKRIENVKQDLQNYIDDITKRQISHRNASCFWDQINTILTISLTIFTALATALSLLDEEVPGYVVSIITGLSTILSALVSTLKPYDKRNEHIESGKQFNLLMYEMTNCSSLEEFKATKEKFFQAIENEPFLRRKTKSRGELHKLWALKSNMVKDVVCDLYKEQEELQEIHDHAQLLHANDVTHDNCHGNHTLEIGEHASTASTKNVDCTDNKIITPKENRPKSIVTDYVL